jgi:serine protease Do
MSKSHAILKRGGVGMRRFSGSFSKVLVSLGLIVAVVGLLAGHSGAAAQAQAQAQAPTPAPVTSPVLLYSAAIVELNVQVPRDAQSAATLGARRNGSGVIIGDGLVLTIGYLLLEADKVDIKLAGGKSLPGAVAGYDHATGFGLVRSLVPLEGKVLSLGDSDQVKAQQKLYTQGHGEGQATELVVISRKQFTGSWEYLLENPIYTYPPVNNWSGSALISQEGALMGIGSLVLQDAADAPRGVPGNLFVPVNLLKPILEDLLKSGRRKSEVQPWLGITTEVVQGVLVVARVSKDGPADRAGIVQGDIVAGVNRQPVKDQADFYRRVWGSGPAGAEIGLSLFNGGQLRDVKVKTIDRMDFLAKPAGV